MDSRSFPIHRFYCYYQYCIFWADMNLVRSASKTSFYEKSENGKGTIAVDVHSTIKNADKLLQDSSQILPFFQFQRVFQKIMKGLLSRAEILASHLQKQYLQFLQRANAQYKGSIELVVRVGILEVINDLSDESVDAQEIEEKINKFKHLSAESPYEYLICKLLILESKMQTFKGDHSLAHKILKKCLEFNEEIMVEYLSGSEEIRKEIADQTILAHYELYKLKRQHRPVSALQNLQKACQATKGNYGEANYLPKCLQNLYLKEEQLINSIDRNSAASGAFTVIFKQKHHGYEVQALYLWEDEKIVANLIKNKGLKRQAVECSYHIKLDNAKVKMLKESDWLALGSGSDGPFISINEDELLRMLGVQALPLKQNTTSTKIEMRNYTKEDIMKKEHFSSSSEDQSEFFKKDQFKPLRQLGRSHSASRYHKQKDI